MITLMMPVFAEESAPSEFLNQPVEELTTETQNFSLNKDRELQEVPPIKDMYKQPVSKKKIAKKFLFAMVGVGISSIVLYIILTLYNTIRIKFTKKTLVENKEISLETPDNIQDAIRVFLDKTNWNN